MRISELKAIKVAHLRLCGCSQSGRGVWPPTPVTLAEASVP